VNEVAPSEVSVRTNQGVADFDASRLGWGEVVRDVFWITLSGRARSFGEWVPVFNTDGTKFYVEIASFGYSDWMYVGSSVGWHLNVKDDDRTEIEELIFLLFTNPSLLGGPLYLFASVEAGFTGIVKFKDDWFKCINWK
jgi:hypothetical protein